MSSLSEDQLTAQLNTYNLLQSVYCMDGEFNVEPETAAIVDSLQSSPSSSQPPSNIHFKLCIALDTTHSIELNVSLPLRSSGDGIQPVVHLVCPTWMNRRTHTEVLAKIKEVGKDEEDGGVRVMAVVDFLKDNSSTFLPSVEKEETKQQQKDEPLVRVWYYLPSLSTKEKRKDLVDYAHTYKLTGRVVAGKPGMVCVEGTPSNISTYMNEIKSVSWADIPPAHKKITERLREEAITRAFSDMQEVTEEVYQAGMRGTRGNRGDMKELKAYLDNYNLGDRLEKVLEL